MDIFSLRKKLISFFAFVLFLFGCLPLHAQLSVGVEGGYNKNYLITNNANRAFTNYKPLSSFTIGIPVQYKIKDWFAIAADPTFIQKNYRQERSAYFAGVYQDNYNGYVQLPVMGHFMFGGERLKGFANAGLYAGYWVTAKIKGVMPNILDVVDNTTSTGTVYDYNHPYSYDEKYSFDNRKDNRWEIGWVAGLGASYEITDRFQVFAEGRLLYGFTDQQKKYEMNQVPRYNTTYGVNVGVLIHLTTTKNSY